MLDVYEFFTNDNDQTPINSEKNGDFFGQYLIHRYIDLVTGKQQDTTVHAELNRITTTEEYV